MVLTVDALENATLGRFPGVWVALNVSSTGEIYIGSLTGNVFRWYPGWLDHGLGSTEGLRPAN